MHEYNNNSLVNELLCRPDWPCLVCHGLGVAKENKMNNGIKILILDMVKF